MAHQLDFKITLWSDDSDALLKLEKQLLSLNVDHVGVFRLLAVPTALYAISDVDVHSIDINWDDAIPLSEAAAQFEHELTGEGVPQLTEAEFKRLYQGDWSEFDKAEAERIQKLLDDAAAQTNWGQIMHDQIVEELTDDISTSDNTPAVE